MLVRFLFSINDSSVLLVSRAGEVCVCVSVCEVCLSVCVSNMYVAEFNDLGFFNVYVGTVLCIVVFFHVGYYVGMVYRFCFVLFCFGLFVLFC